MNNQKSNDDNSKEIKRFQFRRPTSSKNVVPKNKEETKTNKLSVSRNVEKSTKIIYHLKIQSNKTINKLPVKNQKEFSMYLSYFRKLIYKKKIVDVYYSPYLKLDYSKLDVGVKDIKEIKEENKPRLYYYYKTNYILNKARCSLFIRYYDYKILNDDNEYLTYYFNIENMKIIFQFLSRCLYGGDNYTFYKYADKNSKVETVLVNYNNFITDHLSLINEGKKNKKKIINFMSYYTECDREIFTKDLEESEETPNYHDDLIFLSNNKYIYLKDLPLEKIPNCLPNLFVHGKEILTILKDFLKVKKYTKIHSSFHEFLKNFQNFKKNNEEQKQIENQINNENKEDQENQKNKTNKKINEEEKNEKESNVSNISFIKMDNSSTTNRQKEEGTDRHSFILTYRKNDSSDSTRYHQKDLLDDDDDDDDVVVNNEIGNVPSSLRKRHDYEIFGIEKLIQNITQSEKGNKKKLLRKKSTKIKQSKKKLKSYNTLKNNKNTEKTQHPLLKRAFTQTNRDLYNDFQINRNFTSRKIQKINISKIALKNTKRKKNSFIFFSPTQIENKKSTLPSSKIYLKSKTKNYINKNKNIFPAHSKFFDSNKNFTNSITNMNTDSNLATSINCNNFPKINEKLLYEKNGKILNSEINPDKINNSLIKSCLKQQPMSNQIQNVKSIRKLNFKNCDMFFDDFLKKQEFKESQKRLLNNIIKKYNDFLKFSGQKKRKGKRIITKPNALQKLYLKTDYDNKNFYSAESNNIIYKARLMSEEMKQKQINFENKNKNYLKKANTINDFLKYGNIYS